VLVGIPGANVGDGDGETGNGGKVRNLGMTIGGLVGVNVAIMLGTVGSGCNVAALTAVVTVKSGTVLGTTGSGGKVRNTGMRIGLVGVSVAMPAGTVGNGCKVAICANTKAGTLTIKALNKSMPDTRSAMIRDCGFIHFCFLKMVLKDIIVKKHNPKHTTGKGKRRLLQIAHATPTLFLR